MANTKGLWLGPTLEELKNNVCNVAAVADSEDLKKLLETLVIDVNYSCDSILLYKQNNQEANNVDIAALLESTAVNVYMKRLVEIMTLASANESKTIRSALNDEFCENVGDLIARMSYER